MSEMPTDPLKWGSLLIQLNISQKNIEEERKRARRMAERYRDDRKTTLDADIIKYVTKNPGATTNAISEAFISQRSMSHMRSRLFELTCRDDSPLERVTTTTNGARTHLYFLKGTAREGNAK